MTEQRNLENYKEIPWKLYTKLDSTGQMENFLERHKVLKLTQEEIDYLNCLHFK